MLARNLLRWLVTSFATLLLLWQVASISVQAMPVRDRVDCQTVSACDCGSGMCNPGQLYRAHLREFVIHPLVWNDVVRISPMLPELRPEPRVSLIQVALPPPGHVFPDEAARIPLASPFLRSPKLLL